MIRSSRIAAVGPVIVALAAGALAGWPRLAQADAPAGADTIGTTRATTVTADDPSAVAGPVVLDAPVFFSPGQRLHIELSARTAAHRDLLRIQAVFRDGAGATVAVAPFAARLGGGNWRTVPFELVVPDGAVSVELTWSALVGPVQVSEPTVVSIASTAEQPPGDS